MDYDDIQPVLNPCQAADLARYLTTVPPGDRCRIALAVCRMNGVQWAQRAGLASSRNKQSSDQVMVWRWVSGHVSLPIGAAFRLARAIGLHEHDHMLLLFEHQVAKRRKMHQPVEVRWVNEEGAA